jgi:hypothetical protein
MTQDSITQSAFDPYSALLRDADRFASGDWDTKPDNPTRQSDQAAPADVDLEQPTADELFGWGQSGPQSEPEPESSIAWELADQECARLIAEAMRDESPRRAAEGISDNSQDDTERIAISWGELCEMELEHRETILHEVERGEIVMCPAITNRGKTTLWRNIALSLACGREFPPIVSAGPPRSVLDLDFETRLYRARADITKMLGAITQSERALIGANLHIVADCRIKGRPLTLSDPHHLAIVEAEAVRVRADVIILDTLTAAFEVENENDNSEAARVMKRLTAMALRLNCVVVFLHHIGKAKQEEGQTAHAVHRARGASAYAGFSHAIFSLLPDPTVRERNTLECTKVKGERFEDTILNLDPVSRWFTSAGVTVKAPSVYDRVLEIFNGQPLKTKEIKEKLANLKLSERAIEKALEDAVKAEHLHSPRRGVYQKPPPNPVSAFSARPIGDAENAEFQPVENIEDSGFFNFDENDECGNGGAGFWDSGADESGYLDAIDR